MCENWGKKCREKMRKTEALTRNKRYGGTLQELTEKIIPLILWWNFTESPKKAFPSI